MKEKKESECVSSSGEKKRGLYVSQETFENETSDLLTYLHQEDISRVNDNDVNGGEKIIFSFLFPQHLSPPR
jgi:hypothetical protein